MTKNKRKISLWGLGAWGFTDDFNPNKYPVNWDKFQKHVDNKERSVLFNELFRPLFKEMLAKELAIYRNGGYPLTTALRKEIFQNVKTNAKEMVKTQLAPKASSQQSQKESEDVLPEG